METKKITYIAISLVVLFLMSGCGFVYEKKVDSAYSKLKVGMTKNELDNTFKGIEFLKEQVIVKYPNATDSIMRDSLFKDHVYDDLYPKNIFNSITFDGNVKALSYLINKNMNWPNGWIVRYVTIFYDSNSNKVIGWAKLSTYGEANTWRDNY